VRVSSRLLPPPRNNNGSCCAGTTQRPRTRSFRSQTGWSKQRQSCYTV
jgi:hypothetical protein